MTLASESNRYPFSYRHKHQLNRTAHTANPWACMHAGCDLDATAYTCTSRNGITEYHFTCEEHTA